MITKLTAAQKRAWELIKSELALPDTERQAHQIFGKVYGEPGVYSVLRGVRITDKTFYALSSAGLIEITVSWTHRPRFRLTDAGKAEIAAASK